MRASDIIFKAYNEVGTKEVPAGSNKVFYNTWYYRRAVSGSSYPWCATFISWLFDGSGLCKKTASCLDMLQYFEKNGQIAKTAQAGDIVFFKYSTNSRRTNHVGLVVDVNGKTITTIEGNTSLTSNDNGGSVMKRTRKTNIVAFARPNYDTAYITVQNGSKGVFVIKLQRLLNSKGYSLKEDGSFGKKTTEAVLSYQKSVFKDSKEWDGVVGEKTWTRLLL